MPVLQCPIDSCTYETADVEAVAAAALINLHAVVHQSPSPAATPPQQPRGPKLERPRIKLNASCEEWNAFIRRWDTFRIGSGITDASATGQLLECTSEDLGNIAIRAYPTFTNLPIADATKILKSLAVVPVALGVLRSELSSMVQGPDEAFRTFSARVQGKAETCEFKTSYTGLCGGCHTQYTGETYYTEERIRDVLLNGIANLDIRREALSTDNVHKWPINDIITFVEAREIARNVSPSVGVSALSRYRRANKHDQAPPTRQQSPSPADKSLTASCPDCGTTFHPFTRKSRGWNKKPHTCCKTCWRRRRAPNNGSSTNSFTALAQPSPALGQLSALTLQPAPLPTPDTNQPSFHLEAMTLSHHVFTKRGWKRARLADHPRARLILSPLNANPKRQTNQKTTIVD